MSERTEQGGNSEIGICHVCGEAFDTQEELSNHLMDSHPDDTLGEDVTT
jgi:hypothetical protein